MVDTFVCRQRLRPDGDSLRASSRSITPAHGTVINARVSTIRYHPNAGFAGIEPITYTLRDSHGLLSTGLVTVWVDSGVTGPESPVLANSTTCSCIRVRRCR